MSMHRSNDGFTIIELLVATAVFSTILLLISVGIIQVGKMFYKGVTITATSETARVILEDVSQAIQFNADSVEPVIAENGNSQGFCVGSRRYSYVLHRQLANTPVDEQVSNALVVDSVASCNSLTPAQDVIADPEGRELLGLHMRLANLEVQPLSTEGLYSISLTVIYGDDDLLVDRTGDGNLDSCETITGSEFCSVAELDTIVQKRIQ
ncbi:MAG: prepilin-type N-terminal cleavage/methylation domain-containing protein [Candidatus Saccharibacteria bacterium]|nr:prepilin-type N-terminal cleavage/methylation domain-containing protein [Candidatus Saccharibacteria bacterium]